MDAPPTLRSSDTNKLHTLSQLLAKSYPTTDDTAVKLNEAIKREQIKEKRLLEVAMFAPQWAKLIESIIEWPGLEDAVYWFHAHTNDYDWEYYDQEVKDTWNARIRQWTPLTAEELVDGAVDVQWYHRAYKKLQEKRWKTIQKNAKLASSGNGHTRAKLFADVMSGQITQSELLKRINDKRNKDAVRALGVMPFAEKNKHQEDLLFRYETLYEFLRTSKSFGPQRRASEKRAVETGMANLARTAGYKDPLRLQWAMEREALQDLINGPVSITDGETTVTLAIDERCEPEISVVKKGKKLKAIPAALKKKNKKIAELAARKTDLKRQASRMRLSLEEMMCRGDEIEGEELVELSNHPLLAPMLSNLVFIGDGILGRPGDGGQTLIDAEQNKEPVKKGEKLRIAHPYDLYVAKQWSLWQHNCFAREVIQPFKQVFRELYPITATEKDQKTHSSRYAGHQVTPAQAMALLGGRGWVNVPEEGIRKTFYDQKISAYLEFDCYFYTPAEVEGLTVEAVEFRHSGSGDLIELPDIPPILFSEVMRDVDLIVSVAHRSDVDPEVSESTIEMRAALLRETLELLGKTNVRVEGNFAYIEGKRGEYSIHLGSAIVRKIPGQILCVIPVHAAHRGRIFLPFADDDPKTAEVLSKVILFADDQKILDPTILEQLQLGGKESKLRYASSIWAKIEWRIQFWDKK